MTLTQVQSPNSRSLLNLAREGDSEAFGEICREHEAPLFRHALTLCGNAALAQDLTQDTLVAGWNCLRRYNGRCQFFTWLCAILLNQYRNTLRKKPPLPLDDDANESADAHNAPDQALLASEQAAAVRTCIAALSPKHRQVIFLRFYAGNSLQEIAAALGCSIGTVKSRLFHALENLRRMNPNL
jgi:RNA polymerase sigma-70 factor (ECF subfamily)